TGEPIDAHQALQYSLIDVLAPQGELDAAVDKVAADLGKAGPEALIAAKELVDTVHRLGIENALDYTAEMIARLRVSDEAAEGIMAFLEKRPASWVPKGDGR
ncbi:MAG TPA: enoyl-CoA hydratase-related protein, partial [Candidatus Binatia bacterium]|nr:enoyl-CoA hydratase-related protein [Candidatus Binatia bacterium]